MTVTLRVLGACVCACAVYSRGRWPVHSEWSVSLVCLGPLQSGSCPALFRGGPAAPRWSLRVLREEGSVGALHARVHALAEPRPRHALGRWTAQVAAQMDHGVASEQASGVWGEEGLGQARSRQAQPPTCRQPPRWSQAEQVAMPWGHAGHPRPSAWPGPRGVTLPETAVPRDTLQSRDVLCQQALKASAVPHLSCPGSRGLGGWSETRKGRIPRSESAHTWLPPVTHQCPQGRRRPRLCRRGADGCGWSHPRIGPAGDWPTCT